MDHIGNMIGLRFRCKCCNRMDYTLPSWSDRIISWVGHGMRNPYPFVPSEQFVVEFRLVPRITKHSWNDYMDIMSTISACDAFQRNFMVWQLKNSYKFW